MLFKKIQSGYGCSLIFLVLSIVIWQGCCFSSLRYGIDDPKNDVQIKYDSPANQFQLIFSNNFDYVSSTFILCFRQRPIAVLASDSTVC